IPFFDSLMKFHGRALPNCLDVPLIRFRRKRTGRPTTDRRDGWVVRPISFLAHPFGGFNPSRVPLRPIRRPERPKTVWSVVAVTRSTLGRWTCDGGTRADEELSSAGGAAAMDGPGTAFLGLARPFLGPRPKDVGEQIRFLRIALQLRVLLPVRI